MRPHRRVRLKRGPNFVKAAQFGQKAIAEGFVLHTRNLKKTTCERKSPEDIRVGFVVTKKIGKAVLRNRIRRRLKAAAYEIIGKYGKPGHDYILIGRKYSLHCRYKNLLSDIFQALQKTDAWLTKDELQK